MTLRYRISREILLLMASATVVSGLVVFFGTFILFGLIWEYLPSLATDEERFTGTDFLILAIVILPVLVLAALASFRLARRIVAPLNSLATSARRIKNGDLSARAAADRNSPGETADLVEDFNAMAQRLEDMSNEMMAWNASIAHELRTPLTILKGRLQGMIDRIFTLDEASLTGLLNQVNTLARLVEDLRTVTLADSGHLDLQLADERLKPPLSELADMLRHELQSAGISLQLDLADLGARVDILRVRQAVLALVNNARRHASPEIIGIALFGRDGKVVIRVDDDGPGLDGGDLPRLSKPFVRGSSRGAQDRSGSGLGLSVVRAIAEAHGGHLEYRAGPRGGAAFELIFDRR
jgi:two-component system sensor histidine kinase AdeS